MKHQAAYDAKHVKELKTKTPKQMLQELTIALYTEKQVAHLKT